MKIKIIAATGILIVLALGYFTAFRKEDTAPGPAVVSEKYASAEGKVEIIQGFEVDVSSELEGKIARLKVREGDIVNKGDLLAEMDNSDIKARLKEAEAELDVSRSRLREVAAGAREEEIRSATAVLESALAESRYEEASLERHRDLFRKGFIQKDLLDEKERNFEVTTARVKKAREEKILLEKGPRQETLRLNEDQVKKAEAAVDFYKTLLAKTLIKAPISGKVIRRYMQPGETVNKEAPSPVVTLADMEKTRINAEVDETDIGLILVGNPVEIRSDAFPGKVFRGEVEEIADYAGQRKVRPNDQARNLDAKVIQVKIGLKEKTAFRPGMTVDVKILQD